MLAFTVAVTAASWLFSVLTGAATAALFVLVVLQFVDTRHRRSGLCLRCFATAPLDGSGEAERRRGLLRVFHSVATPFGLALFLAGMMTPTFLRVVLDGADWWRIPSQVLVFSVMGLTWVHRRYRPWCPYCRNWDNDGDREPSPPPTNEHRLDA
ncbi:hypothetical protein [Gordonia iterans]